MPRKASGKAEAQRERQKRYRRRLRTNGVPEADAVDSAVSASVSALLELVRLQAEDAREAVRERRGELRLQLGLGVLGEADAAAAEAELAVPIAEAVAKPQPLLPEDVLQRVLRGAVALLVDRDCDPAAAKRRILHRVGRGGDPAQLAELIDRSGVTLRAGRKRVASRGDHA